MFYPRLVGDIGPDEPTMEGNYLLTFVLRLLINPKFSEKDYQLRLFHVYLSKWISFSPLPGKETLTTN